MSTIVHVLAKLSDDGTGSAEWAPKFLFITIE